MSLAARLDALPDLPEPVWDALEDRVEAFEAAWARGERPSPADYLADDATGGQLLVELVHSELELRLKAGEPARAGDYLAAYPALSHRPGVADSLRALEASLRGRVTLRQTAAVGLTVSELQPGAADQQQFDPTMPEAALARHQVGRFRLERVLGRGGFGVVYLANDPTLGRPVAVKIPHPHIVANAGLRARFVQESRAAAAIEHPNINPVYEAGDADGLSYLVSAYCPGPNLAEWLAERNEPVPLRTAALLLAALADAVDFSHRQGVLHRDLKPANVLLAPPPPTAADDPNAFPFVPRLTDFGLAKVVEESLTVSRTSVVMGTPLYMSPEQAAGASIIGPSADIYSLGVMLYELVCGRVPFEGSFASVLQSIREEPPQPPRTIRPDLPSDLETICLKCLHKEPRHRYATAGELAADLRRFLSGEAVQARPLSARERLAAWCRRPERLRDAGILAIVVNVLVVLWLEVNHLLVTVGAIGLSSEIDWREIVLSSIAIGLTFHVPMTFIGIATLRQRRWSIGVGAAISLIVLLFAIGIALGLLPTFDTLYRNIRFRLMIFTMLILMFAVQLLAYLTALVAVRSGAVDPK